jgi:dolichol-phosphate mannosyltransferase
MNAHPHEESTMPRLGDSPFTTHPSRFTSVAVALLRSERLHQFIKFCLVGGSGVFVDMGVLFLLADPRCLGLNITLSKICAAEAAMINNFVWNELWTFRRHSTFDIRPSTFPTGRGEVDSTLSSSTEERAGVRSRSAIPHSQFVIRNSLLRRFLFFNAICGIGIGLAVLLLHLLHTYLSWNLYLSNFLAIILVALWNFVMNARWNWRTNWSRAINT